MYTLLLNATEGLLQCGVAYGTSLLGSVERATPKLGTEFFAPILQYLLAMLNIKPSNIDKILCINGPASFTGVRLSTSTAMAFALPHAIPCATCSLLQAIALNAPPLEKPLIILTKAQKQLLYTQTFLNKKPISDIICVSPQHFIDSFHEPAFLLGNGIDLLDSIPLNCSLLPLPHSPTLSALVQNLNLFHFQNPFSHPIMPLYARTVDAEQNLPLIAEKLGFSQLDIKKALTQKHTLQK